MQTLSTEEEAGPPHFEIDSETGNIRTSEHFTQNTKPVYTLKICARDGGAPPLEDIAVLYVQVFSFLLSVFSNSMTPTTIRKCTLLSTAGSWIGGSERPGWISAGETVHC